MRVKLDGYSCVAAKRTSGVVLWSQRGKGFTARFPEIARAYERCSKVDYGTFNPALTKDFQAYLITAVPFLNFFNSTVDLN
jgi:hypothetical protein